MNRGCERMRLSIFFTASEEENPFSTFFFVGASAERSGALPYKSKDETRGKK